MYEIFVFVAFAAGLSMVALLGAIVFAVARELRVWNAEQLARRELEQAAAAERVLLARDLAAQDGRQDDAASLSAERQQARVVSLRDAANDPGRGKKANSGNSPPGGCDFCRKSRARVLAFLGRNPAPHVAATTMRDPGPGTP